MRDMRIGLEWSAPTGVLEAANRRLAELAPPHPRVAWLHAYWEPGEAWCPVERIVIAEMTPAFDIYGERDLGRLTGYEGFTLAAELDGPNPRTLGHYDQVLGRYVYDGLPPAITQRQWLLWRAHRAFARPIWIVQGTRGGHKRLLTDSERALLRFHGKAGDVPAPGDAPYAVVDHRTIDQLAKADRMRRWFAERGKGWSDRSTRDVWEQRAADELELRTKLVDWLDAQLEDFAGQVARHVDLSALPRASEGFQHALGGAAAHREAMIAETPTNAAYRAA